MFPEGLENTPFKVIGHVTSSVLVMGETNVPCVPNSISFRTEGDHRMYLKCPRKVIFNIYFKVIFFVKIHFKVLHIFFHAFLQYAS